MDSRLNQVHSETHSSELMEGAVRFDGPIRRLGAAVPVTVRAARGDDRDALERLAELDERPLPGAPLLIAEIGAQPLAALSLADDGVIADPFVPTREIVALLRLRARQLRGRRLTRMLGRTRTLLV